MPRELNQIEINAEPLISITQAARDPRYVVDGRSPNKSTIHRHITPGVMVNGRRYRLEAVRRPGGLRTSAAAIGRFFAAINDCPHSADADAGESTRSRKSEIESAERELAAAGL